MLAPELYFIAIYGWPIIVVLLIYYLPKAIRFIIWG